MIDATHTTERGYLYRITHRTWNLFSTGVEFWDEHCNKWRSSIVWKSDLKEIVK